MKGLVDAVLAAKLFLTHPYVLVMKTLPVIRLTIAIQNQVHIYFIVN